MIGWKLLHTFKSATDGLQVLFCNQACDLLLQWKRLVSLVRFASNCVGLIVYILTRIVIDDGLRPHVEWFQLPVNDLVRLV